MYSFRAENQSINGMKKGLHLLPGQSAPGSNWGFPILQMAESGCPAGCTANLDG